MTRLVRCLRDLWLDWRIARWHDGHFEGSLHDYLGMSEQEYRTWVERR